MTHLKNHLISVVAALVTAGIVTGGAFAADSHYDGQTADQVAGERIRMVEAHVSDTARQARAAKKSETAAVMDGRARQMRVDRRALVHALAKAKTRAESAADQARSEGYSNGSSAGYSNGSSAGYASGSSDGHAAGLRDGSDELTCSDDMDVPLPMCNY